MMFWYFPSRCTLKEGEVVPEIPSMELQEVLS